MSKNMLCVEVTISLYDLWPRERKSVRERYNFEGRGDVIKPSNVLRRPEAV